MICWSVVKSVLVDDGDLRCKGHLLV